MSAKITHGLSGTATYNSYKNMLARCYDPESASYHLYGGRGITVCARWLALNGIELFVADLGLSPSTRSREYSLERIDGDGNYEPGNVHWATATEQARNRRSNRLVTARAITQTVGEWSEQTGIPYSALYFRARLGESGERFLRPLGNQNRRRNGQ